MIAIETLLLVSSGLLVVSIIASKTSGRLGVPALLLFLVIGMLAGSEGPGGIAFDDPWIAQSLGVVALALILFAGGLDTAWAAARPVLWHGIALATLGVLLTAAALGVFVHLVLGFSLLGAFLLGAIVSSTDAAAVFAVLRSKNVGLRGRLTPLLELESGSNDPMAVFLTLACIGLLTPPGAGVGDVAVAFVLQMSVGAAAGYLMGRLMVVLVNRLRLEYEGLYPVLTLSLVLLTYAGTTALGGNGFLAVYAAGLMMGNADFVHKRSLVRFHDGLADADRDVPHAGAARLPLAAGRRHRPRHRHCGVPDAGGAAPRRLPHPGAGAHVAGGEDDGGLGGPARRGPDRPRDVPAAGRRPRRGRALRSRLLRGADVGAPAGHLDPVRGAVARRRRPPPGARRAALEPQLLGSPRGRLQEIPVRDGSRAVGRRILDLGLPSGALIVLLKRAEDVIIPDGGTALDADDILVVLADERVLPTLRSVFEGGDGGPPPVARPPREARGPSP